ncbi:hypothetical protein F5Y14DRAFT_410989 [Nemania sp. NC0429]|nr:hypothetical protein F5Y14DRAFT_410989 [Nemania sp. NC0429]
MSDGFLSLLTACLPTFCVGTGTGPSPHLESSQTPPLGRSCAGGERKKIRLKLDQPVHVHMTTNMISEGSHSESVPSGRIN